MIAGLGYGLAPDGDEVFCVFVAGVEDGALRRVTPWEERAYKEGLEWHPSGEWMTYLSYGTDSDSEIRRAYPDGRPTELLLNQDQHWDYVGGWHLHSY